MCKHVFWPGILLLFLPSARADCPRPARPEDCCGSPPPRPSVKCAITPACRKKVQAAINRWIACKRGEANLGCHDRNRYTQWAYERCVWSQAPNRGAPRKSHCCDATSKDYAICEKVHARRGPPEAPKDRCAAGTTPLPKGYDVYPATKLEVLYARPAKGNGNAPTPPEAARVEGRQVVVSGTFHDGKSSAGTILRNSRLDAGGLGKTGMRGGVAVMNDGSIRVVRQAGMGEAGARKAAGEGVKDFMGGGALLIEEGNKVPWSDILHDQCFDQPVRSIKDGTDAAQMRGTTWHTVVAQKGGAIHVIVAKNRSGQQIQSDLCAAGYDAAVKFDGGHGQFVKTSKGIRHPEKTYHNLSGLRVTP